MKHKNCGGEINNYEGYIKEERIKQMRCNRCEKVVNKSEITNEGETRIYATDDNGAEVFDMYLKNNGTMEIKGTGDNLLKYLALNTSLQTFVTDLNAKLVIAFTAVAGSWPGTSIDISGSKIDEIKTGL